MKPILLFVTIAAGLATQWIAERWAWAAIQTAILALAAFLLLEHAAGKRRVRLDWRVLPLAGAALVGVVQILSGATVNAWETRTHVLNWLTWLSAFWIASETLAAAPARERFLRWTGAYTVALAALAMLHRHIGDGRVFWIFDTGRPYVMGVFPYENQYAAFIMLALPALLRFALADARAARWWTIGSGVALASVLSSGSVGGAALLLAVAVFAVVRNRPPAANRAFRTAALVAVIAAAGAAVVGWREMSSDLARASPYQLRRQLTESTVAMARDRWLTGWGLGAWPIVYPAYARFDDGVFENAAHNDWAQWAAEGGAPLLALMLAFAAGLVRPAIASRWGSGIAAVLVHCFIEFHFQERPAFGAFFFVWAGALIAEQRERQKPGC